MNRGLRRRLSASWQQDPAVLVFQRAPATHEAPFYGASPFLACESTPIAARVAQRLSAGDLGGHHLKPYPAFACMGNARTR